MVRYMRLRNRFFISVLLLGGLPLSASAAQAVGGWGPAWQQSVPAGGPVRLSRALIEISPKGQTVVVDLPGAARQARVRWPAGTRRAALKAAVLDADRGAAIALGKHCAGNLLTVYTHTPPAALTSVRGPSPSAEGKHTGGPPVPVGEVDAAGRLAASGSATPFAHPLVASLPRTPAAPPAALPRVWLISKGELMSAALRKWGRANGWTIIWKAKRLARLWHAPAFAAIPGTFLSAVGLWAHSAIANGAPIRLIEYHANTTLVVESTNGDDNGF